MPLQHTAVPPALASKEQLSLWMAGMLGKQCCLLVSRRVDLYLTLLHCYFDGVGNGLWVWRLERSDCPFGPMNMAPPPSHSLPSFTDVFSRKPLGQNLTPKGDPGTPAAQTAVSNY